MDLRGTGNNGRIIQFGINMEIKNKKCNLGSLAAIGGIYILLLNEKSGHNFIMAFHKFHQIFIFLFFILLFTHFCQSQTTLSTVDQEACVRQCMTTGVNCTSGCGYVDSCATGWKGLIKRRCYMVDRGEIRV